MSTITYQTRVHTPEMIKEILTSKDMGIMHIPLLILRGILAEVAQRSAELNDPKMNALMMRLTLYEVSDPNSKEYNADLVNQTIESAYTPQGALAV